MVGFYKHDIPAWMDGTETLSDGAYRAYHVILQLIMLNEGPIARNERGIAGRCNQTLKTFSRNLAELIAARKLRVVDGRLDNGRAATELEAIRVNRMNAGKGGRISRKPGKISENLEKTPADFEKPQETPENQSANQLKNNDASEASLAGDVSLKEKIREDSPIVPKGTDRFEEFRAAYPPRNVRFQATLARKRWLEALKRGADPEQIIAGAKSYAAEQAQIGKAGTEFVKTAEVWLRNQLWNDYQLEPAAAGQDVPVVIAEDQCREWVRQWKQRGGYWPWRRVLPPNDPRTTIPAHILLTEAGIEHSASALKEAC